LGYFDNIGDNMSNGKAHIELIEQWEDFIKDPEGYDNKAYDLMVGRSLKIILKNQQFIRDNSIGVFISEHKALSGVFGSMAFIIYSMFVIKETREIMIAVFAQLFGLF